MAGKTVRKNRPEIKLNSYEDLFGESPAHADTTEVLIKELHEFENHPFHVVDDDDMAELVQSITAAGAIVLAWGVFDFAAGYQAHDTSQQTQSLKKVVAGILMLLAQSVVNMLS